MRMVDIFTDQWSRKHRLFRVSVLLLFCLNVALSRISCSAFQVRGSRSVKDERDTISHLCCSLNPVFCDVEMSCSQSIQTPEAVKDQSSRSRLLSADALVLNYP